MKQPDAVPLMVPLGCTVLGCAFSVELAPAECGAGSVCVFLALRCKTTL